MRLLKSWRELVLRLWAHYADFSLPRLWLKQISKRSILLEFSSQRSSTALSASIWEPTFLHCLPALRPLPTTRPIVSEGVSYCAGERRRHIPRRVCSTCVGVYDHIRRGSARHLECRDRFLVVSRRATAARRWRRRAPWTIHRRH